MSRRRRQRGFSMIEVLAALALFALVAVATVALAAGTIRQAAANRQGMAAVFLANQEMEYQRGRDYPNMISETRTQAVDNTSYRINSSVLTDVPAVGISTVTVTVSWTGNAGAKTYAITSYFTNVNQ